MGRRANGKGKKMNAITVGQNDREMRDLAIQIMRDNYRAADNAAKDGRLKQGELYTIQTHRSEG